MRRLATIFLSYRFCLVQRNVGRHGNRAPRNFTRDVRITGQVEDTAAESSWLVKNCRIETLQLSAFDVITSRPGNVQIRLYTPLKSPGLLRQTKKTLSELRTQRMTAFGYPDIATYQAALAAHITIEPASHFMQTTAKSVLMFMADKDITVPTAN